MTYKITFIKASFVNLLVKSHGSLIIYHDFHLLNPDTVKLERITIYHYNVALLITTNLNIALIK